MERLRLNSSFIVRVHSGKHGLRITVHDLHNGQSQHFSSWEAFLVHVSSLTRSRGLK